MSSDSSGTDARGSRALRSVGEEEADAAHLEERLRAALKGLNEARAALHAQPQNFERATEVMQRVHLLRHLRAQCDVQRARVGAARAAAGLDPFPADRPGQPAARQDPFRATQARRADQVIAALTAHPRTCPACQAPLPPSAARCHCGCLLDPPADPPRAGTARRGI